jgi:hypothetical protein
MSRFLGSSLRFGLVCAIVGLVCGCGSPARDDLGGDLLAAIAGPADEAIDRQTSGGLLVAIRGAREGPDPGESPGFRRYLESRGLPAGSEGFCSRVIRRGRVEFVSTACR